MSLFLERRSILLVLVVVVGVIIFILYDAGKHPAPPVTKIQETSITAPTLLAAPLSPLAQTPDWKALERYQKSITHSDFETLLTSIYTTDDGWKKSIEIRDKEALIQTGEATPNAVFHLRFSSTSEPPPPPQNRKSLTTLPPAPFDKPLSGLRIAIDPGHIGGAWAKMEERWFAIGDGKPVCEGDMTLEVAKILKPLLENLGAEVLMVRTTNEPVTSIRPKSLLPLIAKSSVSTQPTESPQKAAERLFYRTAEIHARAKYVNKILKPDLVLCLHFNAEGWGDPLHPTLTDRHHFHILVNGAYSGSEISFADQRFELLEKLLQRTLPEEIAIGADIAKSFEKFTDLPPYQYLPTSKNARPIPDQPFLWARNLLANRLYECPVIFMEPYVMNSTMDYARIQAGDYEGLRKIDGKMLPSIFREYADAVADGLETHFSSIHSKLGE